ncbi:hypothetical protein VTO42DRAFT_2498 [Malbranchea cinnamomea]
MMASSGDDRLKELEKYSVCDVSDALLKLQKVPKGETPFAGHLSDLAPFSPSRTNLESLPKVIGYASTFRFVPKDDPLPDVSSVEEHGFPPGRHWVDWAQPDTVVLIDQPAGQRCATLGGIMAARMKVLGVRGVVVNGRVRDLAELQASGLQVWARGTSTVGTGAEAKPGARNVPINIGGVTVCPGDVVFCEPQEGVAVIPRGLLDDVLALMPKLVAADDKVKEDVLNGSPVFDAFKKYRG